MSALAYMLKAAAAPVHNPNAAQLLGSHFRRQWGRAKYPLIGLLSIFGASQLGKYLSDSTLNRNFPERIQEAQRGIST